MNSREPIPIGAELCGTYTIERVLGVGGFGITYLATDNGLRTQVAIKEYFPAEFASRDHSYSIHPAFDKQTNLFERWRANFLEEARMLARFDHPAIVRVIRIFEAGNTAYFVQKFEDGDTLKDWLDGLGRAPTQSELDAIVGPLLDALSLVHARGIIHRDIAPDNIIIRKDGSPVLIDFGSARRAAGQDAAAAGTMTGIFKMGYSPPEQYSTRAALQGTWTDLYAFGATLYRAVAGFVPPDGTERNIEDKLPRAAAVAKGTYRPQFLAAIDWALKLKPSDRPQSAAALRTVLLGQPQPAAPSPRPNPPPTPRQGAPWWQQMAAALLLIGGGSVVGMRATLPDKPQSGPVAPEQVAQAPEPVRKPENAARVDAWAGRAAPSARQPVILSDPDKERRDLEAERDRKAAEERTAAEKKRRDEDGAQAQAQARFAAERQRQEAAAAAAAQARAEAQRRADAEAAQARRTPVLFTHANHALEGLDLQPPIKNIDQSQCAHACTSAPSCKGYAFDKWNGWCFLKESVGVLRLDPKYVSGSLPGFTPQPSSQAWKIDKYHGKAFPDAGSSVMKLASYDACMDFCRTEQACMAVSYFKSSRQCKWLTNPGEYFADPDADSGVKRQE